MTLNPNILSKNLGSETALMDQTSGEYFVLNEVGSFVWSLLQAGESDESTLVAAVSAEFEGCDQELVTTDIGELVNQLLERKILLT